MASAWKAQLGAVVEADKIVAFKRFFDRHMETLGICGQIRVGIVFGTTLDVKAPVPVLYSSV